VPLAAGAFSLSRRLTGIESPCEIRRSLGRIGAPLPQTPGRGFSVLSAAEKHAGEDFHALV